MVSYIQTINLFRGSSGPEEIELDKDTADVINRINPAQHIQTNNKGKVHFDDIMYIFIDNFVVFYCHHHFIMKTSLILLYT